MSTNKKTPAFEKALTFLGDKIDMCKSNGSQRLPTIVAMAAESGVSPASMWKAVRVMVDRGTLSAAHYNGIRITGKDTVIAQLTEENTPLRAPEKRAWRRVVEILEKQIVTGEFHGGILPPPKELTKIHNVCFRTLKKALDKLNSDGCIRPFKKTYAVCMPSVAAQGANEVVLIAKGNRMGVIQETTPWIMEQFRLLEMECSRRNLSLTVVTFDYEDKLYPQTLSRGLHDRHRGKNIIGFLVWPIALPSPVLTRIIAGLPSGKPVIILDEEGREKLSLNEQERRRIKMVSIATGKSAGVAVGRYLYTLGHRHVAYFSPFQHQQWSLNRSAGMKKVFNEFGNGSVEIYSPGQIPLQTSLRKYADIVRGGLERVQKSVDNKKIDKDQRKLVTATSEALKENLLNDISFQAQRLSLIPLFEKAIERKDVAAWVGANDVVALECLRFLSAEGVKVPEEISVIGFDDSSTAYLHKITSYNFNTAAVIRTMLGYVTAPEMYRREKHAVATEEIEGFITVRATTRLLGTKEGTHAQETYAKYTG